MAPRDIFVALTVAMTCALGALLLSWNLPLVAGAENASADLRLAALSPPEPQDDAVVVVAVTEETLATLPYRSPLDRGFLAKLLRKLSEAGPLAIGVDVLIDQPTEPEKDDALQSILRASPVPIVMAAAGPSDRLTESQRQFHETFLDGVPQGRANLLKDSLDGTVRWIFPGSGSGSRRVPGLAGALAEIAGRPPLLESRRLAYRAAPPGGEAPFKTYPAHAVAFLPKAWFAGKLVLVGADLPLIDRHRTPFAVALGATKGEIPGVVIHAHALSQLLNDRQAPYMGTGGEVALVLVLAVVGVALAAVDLSLAVRAAAYGLVLVAYWVGGFVLYRQGGPLIPLVSPSIALLMAGGAGVAYLGRQARRQRKMIRETFSRYVSPSVVEQLLSAPDGVKVGGERRELTYLFTDLAGFTSLTEQVDPKVLVPVINEYLEGLCRILVEHDATLDKIVGDAVVAFFNAPVGQPDHPARAAACALALDAYGQAFVERQAEAGLSVGVTRIGVHTGEAIVGNFGGEVFFDYTAHGDTVNTAARLESVNKHLGTRVCISAMTAERCSDVAFRPVGDLVLKGKTEGIAVCEPLDAAQAGSPSTVAYEEAFALMRSNKPEAFQAFQAVLELAPDDPLAKLHIQRLERGETGTLIVMKEK